MWRLRSKNQAGGLQGACRPHTLQNLLQLYMYTSQRSSRRPTAVCIRRCTRSFSSGCMLNCRATRPAGTLDLRDGILHLVFSTSSFVLRNAILLSYFRTRLTPQVRMSNCRPTDVQLIRPRNVTLAPAVQGRASKAGPASSSLRPREVRNIMAVVRPTSPDQGSRIWRRARVIDRATTGGRNSLPAS